MRICFWGWWILSAVDGDRGGREAKKCYEGTGERAHGHSHQTPAHEHDQGSDAHAGSDGGDFDEGLPGRLFALELNGGADDADDGEEAQIDPSRAARKGRPVGGPEVDEELGAVESEFGNRETAVLGQHAVCGFVVEGRQAEEGMQRAAGAGEKSRQGWSWCGGHGRVGE